MKDKKSLFEQVAAIIFGLSLVAGVGFLFFAACAHAFSGSTAPYRTNTSMCISLGDDLLLVKCRACGKQTVERPGDVVYGCTCKGKGPSIS